MKGQTKIETFVEAAISKVLSFIINVFFILLVAPLFDINISLSMVTGGAAVLYGIHLLKSFLYRRLWNWILIKQYNERVKNEK